MAYAVQNAPGIPPLLGGLLPTSFPTSPSQIVDISNTLPGSVGPQWGIFLNGAPVITADTVVGEDYRQEWVIADFPIEDGGFQSYDKVARPFDVRMTFATGINAANRAQMINSIAAIAGDMNLYEFVSPEVIYQSVSIAHYDYHREPQRGVGLLPISVWGWQIAIEQTGALSNTANPGGNDKTVTGPSQPVNASGGIGSDYAANAQAAAAVPAAPYFGGSATGAATPAGSAGIGSA